MIKYASILTPDKLLHFSAGFILFTILSAFFVLWVPIVAVLVAAIGKEVWDKWSGKGQFEWLDMIFTWTGGFIAWLITIV